MSLSDALANKFATLFRAVGELQRQFGLRDRELTEFKRSINDQLNILSEVQLAPFAFTPPLMLMRIESQLSSSGLFTARRMDIQANQMVLDIEDTRVFLVRSMPGETGVFVGARVWVQQIGTMTSPVAEDDGAERGVYGIVSGESHGFEALISGAPTTDENDDIFYPWVQDGLYASDEYTSDTVIHEGGAPFGNAKLTARAGWDLSFDPPRVTIAVNTPVFIHYSSTDGCFFISQVSEPQLEECD